MRRLPPRSTRTDNSFPTRRSSDLLTFHERLLPGPGGWLGTVGLGAIAAIAPRPTVRSEEHTSELQSLMRNSYAVFCLKKKTIQHHLMFDMKLLHHLLISADPHQPRFDDYINIS